ncbi:Ribosome-recycling factor [Candidatus Magnetaquicoccaceae bacterium FCR-1]|uniref:Ribosome-recycling factor n=1 Tax=Candidatus Magnetaquiglobus chichijimensis TaxID=3141448 RepID=A0ABQ0C634_9PROT
MIDPAVMQTLDQRMTKTILALKEELSAVRTGRASTNLLDRIVVQAYGSETPLNQVATLNVPEPRLITIQPWDKKLIKAIEKGILESDLGLNPSNDGVLIRVPLPELNEERRKELVKMVQKTGEQTKVALRNVRREAMEMYKKQEKNKEISQDDLRHLEKVVQEHTDQRVKEVDEIVAHKEADVMRV